MLSSRGTAHKRTSLNIVGGGSKNVLLNKFTAEAIKRPVIAGPSEGTVIGNLLMQAIALGEIEDIWALRRVVEASFPTETCLPETDGKISAEQIEKYCADHYRDESFEHIVQPGMVYISHPTEYGTLYSLRELEALSAVCNQYGMRLYADGARLAYALGCPENDVTLPDLARLCDVFYIGGTKCGALLGEAVVIPKRGSIPHFFTIVKQHGALLAKGRVLGIQFDALFTDDLYLTLGAPAVKKASRIKKALTEKGYTLFFDAPTNQIYVLLTDEQYAALGERLIMSFWEKPDEYHTAVRLATSWATTDGDVERLVEIL